MPGKAKAGLLGAIVGAVVVLFIELLAVVINDDVFFGAERSWLMLVVVVAGFAWFQMRAYDQKKGMYGDKDDPPDGNDPARPER